MGRKGNGVEVRAKSIRLSFTVNGEPFRETLKTNGVVQLPTPNNIKAAHQLAAMIRAEISLGTFVYANHFGSKADTGKAATVADVVATFVDTLTGIANSTAASYASAAKFWTESLGEHEAAKLVKSDILKALAKKQWSGKTLNLRVGLLRRAFALAVADKVLTSNVVDSIDSYAQEDAEPNPFSREEADAIVADMRREYGDEVADYFAFKFYTGLRTCESLVVGFEDVTIPNAKDLKAGKPATVKINKGLVQGQLRETTKNGKPRTVYLNDSALAILRNRLTASSRIAGPIFVDPKTGEAWTSDEGPRERYWRPTLERLAAQGIAYRSPYNTRHTYASMMLMAGMAAGYCAGQMGHTTEEFNKTYARWINGERDMAEHARINAFLAVAATAAAAAPQRAAAAQ